MRKGNRELLRTMRVLLGTGAGLAFAGVASGQLIRPNSATATSEFSGSFAITNVINGSGLPAGFGLTDAHASYTNGNHWTTAAGRTIGESASFTFNAPTSLGGFHMWAHRSNNIANNSNYEVTSFDLVLFSGPNRTGSELARFTDLIGVPDLAIAQTTAFTITPGVRSVQFIVRATQNNNSSPFTGLAEVAFAACIAAGAGDAPPAATVCPAGAATFTARPAGSGPFTFRWQIEDASVAEGWADINDGTVFTNGQRVGLFAGSRGPTLSAEGFYVGPEVPVVMTPVQLRCIITNACGTATTQTTLAVCPSDFNCDGDINPDDLADYIGAFFSVPTNPGSDFNGDGLTDPDDLADFIGAFFALC